MSGVEPSFSEMKGVASLTGRYSRHRAITPRSCSGRKEFKVSIDDRSLRPGRKARWIARAGRDLRRRFPEIDAVSWWNEDYREAGEGVRLRIDSSPSALRAYRRAFDSRRYRPAPRFGPR